tara:strand:+ start:186 stop:419 length:234 start_codon:yes stop_codon:yes gene_type:complete
MNPEKQILEWKEELKSHKERLQQAEAVVKQETELISMIRGGIEFGEMLLKKNESSNQQLDTEASEQESDKMSSKSKA